jgi:photosynthetic reaction center cytochrome c subunit
MSTPQRATAWYGIRMVRDLNNNYIMPIASEFPPIRLGPMGDAPKIYCATCHQGTNKPLYGAPQLPNYPELLDAKPGVPTESAPQAAPAGPPPGATPTTASVAAEPATASLAPASTAASSSIAGAP